MGDTVLSLDLVPSLGDMVALWEDTASWEDTVLWEDTALWEDMALWEDTVVLWEDTVVLWEDTVSWEDTVLVGCPTSPCTSLCRARTGASPSPRLSDPLSLLLLITLAPPTVSAPTG